MKTKAEKIELLNGIISCVEGEQYGVKGNMMASVEEAEIFMRNCTGWMTYRKWQKDTFPVIRNLLSAANQSGEFARNKKFNDVQWSDWLDNQKRNWINSKNKLINTLKLCKREIELFDEDKNTSDDPLELLKQRFFELIDTTRDAVDELESRIEDLESLLDEAEDRIDDIESRADDASHKQ